MTKKDYVAIAGAAVKYSKREDKMYYVTTTDKFMSGWGPAREKTNKLIFPCETYQDAVIVAENAENRTDQKHINIRSTKPYYNQARYFVQIKTKAEYPSWYKKGFFKKG